MKKIVQIAVSNDTSLHTYHMVYAVCEDGTAYRLVGDQWKKLPDIKE